MKNWISLDNPSFLWISPYGLRVHDKKEISRVPGSSDQKTDFGRFGEHPTLNVRNNFDSQS